MNESKHNSNAQTKHNTSNERGERERDRDVCNNSYQGLTAPDKIRTNQGLVIRYVGLESLFI